MQDERRKRDANVETVKRFFQGTHTGVLDVVDETVSEGIETHGFPGGNPSSREEYKQWFRTFSAAFSNMAFEIKAIAADDEHVAVRWLVSVDHTGTFAGISPTGRRISFDGMALYRMENGLIAETWLHPNERSLIEQITGDAATLAA